MPLMTSIRERLSLFFSIFAGLFVVYIILDWGMDIGGRRHSTRLAESQEIGKIDGKPILAKEFSEMVRRTSDQQKAQTGTDPDEAQERTIREQVWTQVVDDMLYDEQVKKLGITVTDQEIVDWVRGDNPPAFLRQQFTDSTGTFNRQVYDATIMDPKNKAIMAQVEQALRKQREREKLQSLVMASVQIDENDVVQRYKDQNIKYDANYLFFDPNVLVKDDEIKVTDDDARRFYNEHSDEYKMDASRRLKYVLFPETASKADTAAVLNDMQDISKRANAGVDFGELAKTYSDNPVIDSTYRKHGALNPDEEIAVFDAKPGEILGPLKENDGFHLIKVLDFKPDTGMYVHASHILISVNGSDSTAALKQAKELAAKAKGGADFGQLAKQYSNDPGSGAKGGDLGWFSKGRMVKPFEEAAFRAKPGQVVGPVRSQFGYHIIKVLARDNREVRMTDIRMAVRPSSDTKNETAQRAQDFAFLAKQGQFQKEAEQSKYTVQETPPFQKDGMISGIGMNTAVNKFAFKNKVGTASDPITVTNGVAVFMVSEVKEAGVRPFEELKTVLLDRTKREKKLEKVKQLAAEMRQSLAPGDSLTKIAQKNPALSVQRLPSFTLSGYIPGIGRDLAFTGAIAALNAGEISKPVEGTRGVYVIHLLGKSTFDSTAFNAQKQALATQLLSEKRNRFFTDWVAQLKKSAEIVDNRDMFYR